MDDRELYEYYILQLHGEGFGYKDIARKIRRNFPNATPNSVKKFLCKWRKANAIKSLRTLTREQNERVIAHYESTACKLKRSELAEWANANEPRGDGRDWTPTLISQTLHEWRHRTGKLNQWEERALGLWDRIHVLMTTGYTARMVADLFNCESYRIVGGKPWTIESVKQYHHKYSQRFSVDLSADAYRTERECMEIAFFVQLAAS